MNTVPYKQIWRTWRFKSSSSNKSYETILYDDLTTSCDCFGWCRRIDKSGKRWCKHTRMVEIGIKDMAFSLADDESVGKFVQADIIPVAHSLSILPPVTGSSGAVLSAGGEWIPAAKPLQKKTLADFSNAKPMPPPSKPPPPKKEEPPQPTPVPLRKLNRGYKP